MARNLQFPSYWIRCHEETLRWNHSQNAGWYDKKWQVWRLVRHSLSRVTKDPASQWLPTPEKPEKRSQRADLPWMRQGSSILGHTIDSGIRNNTLLQRPQGVMVIEQLGNLSTPSRLPWPQAMNCFHDWRGVLTQRQEVWVPFLGHPMLWFGVAGSKKHQVRTVENNVYCILQMKHKSAAQLDLQGQTDSFIGQLPSFATASEMFKQELG